MFTSYDVSQARAAATWEVFFFYYFVLYRGGYMSWMCECAVEKRKTYKKKKNYWPDTFFVQCNYWYADCDGWVVL